MEKVGPRSSVLLYVLDLKFRGRFLKTNPDPD
jgi:hypothetical protein